MGNEKSKINKKFDDLEQISTQSKAAIACLQRINVQKTQNVLLVWLDNSIDDNNNADCRNTISQFRQIINDVNTFTNAEETIQFINRTNDIRICIIISDSFGQQIVPRIHNMSQVESIFIFSSNKKLHEQWTKDWSKIKGIFTDISSICKSLKQVAQQCEQNSISMSFVTTGTSDDLLKKNLDQLDPIFVYSQILKEILLTVSFDEKHIKQFLNYCCTMFAGNDGALEHVEELQTKYHKETPIWWYTSESFLYPMLNRGLRMMDMDIIMKMSFFIIDLHREIEQLHVKQFVSNYRSEIFTVYRGQSMSKIDFNKLKKTQDGLISFNNFLSTSKNRQVSLNFASRSLPNVDMVGILFIITINPAESTTPFASFADVGDYGAREDGVLFSMAAIFRIADIRPIHEITGLFQVILTLISDNDEDLCVLTDHIREETYSNEKGWHRLGSLLLKMGELAKAQQVYEMLLDQIIDDDDEKARIFHQLAWVKDSQGEYQEAIILYEKALEIKKKTLSSTDLNLASSYNNIGVVYDNMGDYQKALSYYEKALEIRKQSLPPDHSNLAKSYNNIGLVYSNIGDYTKALLYSEKALEIKNNHFL